MDICECFNLIISLGRGFHNSSMCEAKVVVWYLVYIGINVMQNAHPVC